MILFRAREWGSAEWTLISVNTPGDEEGENGLADTLSSIIGSALSTSSLHVQMMNEEGEWENLQ